MIIARLAPPNMKRRCHDFTGCIPKKGTSHFCRLFMFRIYDDISMFSVCQFRRRWSEFNSSPTWNDVSLGDDSPNPKHDLIIYESMMTSVRLFSLKTLKVINKAGRESKNGHAGRSVCKTPAFVQPTSNWRLREWRILSNPTGGVSNPQFDWSHFHSSWLNSPFFMAE